MMDYFVVEANNEQQHDINNLELAINILKEFYDNAFIQTGKYSTSTSSKSSTTSMTSWSNKIIDDFVVELKNEQPDDIKNLQHPQ